MYSIQMIRQVDVDAAIIERAIVLKQRAWPYPKESQLIWIQNNLQEEDFHVFLLQDGHDIAYLNMVNISCIINGACIRCVGIGNVCSSVSGGGKTLLSHINSYLVNNNLVGLLFCKDAVVGFYEKCDWKLISLEQVIQPNLLVGTNTMVYNVNNVDTIEYYDRNF